MAEIALHDFFDKVYIGPDFFDASINRIAAWTVGVRNTQKAIFTGILESADVLVKSEAEGDYLCVLRFLKN